uniref:Uncharacterized protein n=1 Tax=Tanacetum cinerariifolium TaxID=118510 RepID=A0A699IHM4_TANCI|nr:hypothetical protein [Tanacetum cinerariifolium]
MEDTMLELVEVCRQKEFYYMHNNVDDLIESTLNSKLLSINLNSQHFDKKKQEVKNVVEQPTKYGTRIAESLQNFRVVHKKSSISLKSTSHISSVHAIAPILPNEEPTYSFSMGYEHLNTTFETELDEVVESSAKNLVPIPCEYEVTLDNDSEYEVPVKDEFSAFTTFTNPLFNDKDDFTIHDEDVPIEEYKVYSNPLFDDDEIYSDELESHCFNVESDFVETSSNRDTLIDSSSKFDFLKEFSGALMPTSLADEEHIRREHAECTSLMERLFTINPCPRLTVNANIIVESPPSSLFPVQDNDSQREEIDIVTNTDELLPPGFENDDSEGEIDVIEELRVDNSISYVVRYVVKMMIIFLSCLSSEFFYHILSIPRFFLYFSLLRVKTPSLTLASSFRAGGISLG